MRPVSAKGDDGFTLVELLVALMLVAMIGAAFSYSIQANRAAANPRDVARNIAAEARSASLRAVASGHSAVLRIDMKQRVVSIDDSPPRVFIPKGNSVSVKAAQALIEAEGVGKIEFFPDGASTGGEITIGSSQANRHRVRIFWLTGEITTEQLE